MNRWQKALLAAGVIILAMVAFATWYRVHYSMSVARSFEVPAAAPSARVLIATQGSAFKDAVVSGLADHLRLRSVYAKIVDISALPGIQGGDWDAIVLIHTWEMGKPPQTVKAFVDRIHDPDKLVVLTTSGAGNFKLEGVDAISAASKMVDVRARVAEMSRRIDAILEGQKSP